MAKYLINAPAKINLFLHVVGKSASGYHKLESLFAFIRLFDTLDVDVGLRRRGVKFTRSLGIDKRDNTVQRAIGHMVRRCPMGVVKNVYVKVRKNIPVSAGLAGGSADAGAIIKLLSECWGISESAAEGVAASVGSDVLVCMKSKTAFVRGEVCNDTQVLQGIDLPKHVVLAKPRNARLSTRSVFQAYNPEKFSESITETPTTAEGWLDLIKKSRNDLTEVAISLVPEISDVLTALESFEGCEIARMSGSGATCFALFEDGEKAHFASEYLRAQRPEWWVYETTICQ
ncbi:MAG: 4-(cytidine 5'-diphospho)-2-C-methyl-D-erythritol kinase [Anaplasma sp.]